MKQILVMMVAVVLVGCGKKAAPLPATDTLNKKNKLITNRNLEEDIRESIKKPYGKLTEADLEKVELLVLFGYMDDEGLKEVAKLQNLERLILSVHPDNAYDKSKTKITDEGLKEIAKLQNLTSLSLSRSQIMDEGLKELAKLEKLERLSLTGTKVTKAGVAELKKALPNCDIVGP